MISHEIALLASGILYDENLLVIFLLASFTAVMVLILLHMKADVEP